MLSATLSCEINYSCFAYDVNFDFARTFQFILNAKRDLSRKISRLEITYFFGSDEDSNFAAGLNGVRFFNAVKRIGDGFKVLEAF